MTTNIQKNNQKWIFLTKAADADVVTSQSGQKHFHLFVVMIFSRRKINCCVTWEVCPPYISPSSSNDCKHYPVASTPLNQFLIAILFRTFHDERKSSNAHNLVEVTGLANPLPEICPCCYTTTLFKLVKNTPKSA